MQCKMLTGRKRNPLYVQQNETIRWQLGGNREQAANAAGPGRVPLAGRDQPARIRRAASSTSSAWPGTRTLRHTRAMVPEASIRNVERSIPM